MIRKRGKYLQVAERLSHRIKSGDYHAHGVPPERELATQVGVSYTTVRKAIQRLIDAGLLYRLANGRLAVNSGAEHGASTQQVALLAPPSNSNESALWNIALTQLQTRFNYRSRIVHYVHWDDPIILNTVQQFDATFLLPPEAPPEFAQRLIETGKPLVILNRDWSPLGVRSLRMFPPQFIQKLLDHLASLGHRRVDCFKVQFSGGVMREWVQQWQLWCMANRIDGDLIDEPIERNVDSLVPAYNAISRRIRDGKFSSTALLCLNEAATIGATRALIDFGIRPGIDVAVATVGSSRCEYLNPSITTLEEPDPAPYLAACIEGVLHKDAGHWQGPLLVQPPDLKVVIRESTVPDISKSTTPLRQQQINAAQS